MATRWYIGYDGLEYAEEVPDKPTADDILKAVQYAAERMLTTPIVIPHWIETTDTPVVPPETDSNLPDKMKDTE